MRIRHEIRVIGWPLFRSQAGRPYSSASARGFALNLTADLEYFDGIVPCGHADLRPTSVEALTGARIDTESAARGYAPHFAEAFGVELAWAPADRLRPVVPAS